MRLIGLLLLLIVSSQSANAQISYPPGRWPKADPYGNVYPSECKQDLSFMIRTTNIVITDVEALYPSENGGNRGYFEMKKIGGMEHPTVYIDRSLARDGPRYKIVLHHELCHAYLQQLYNDFRWHPRRRKTWASRKRSRRQSSPSARPSSRWHTMPTTCTTITTMSRSTNTTPR